MMFCPCKSLCRLYLLESGEWLKFFISGRNCMLQPYIESATALSDRIKHLSLLRIDLVPCKVKGQHNGSSCVSCS